MTTANKKLLLEQIKSIIELIPKPAPGRYMALTKTSLEQAELWLGREIETTIEITNQKFSNEKSR